MNILGIELYPKKRPLNAEEIKDHLRQSDRLEVEPHYQLSVIKMNSICMDVVDRHFSTRGQMVAVLILGLTLLLSFFVAGSIDAMDFSCGESAALDCNPWGDILLLGVFLALPATFLIWLSSGELFRLTHYPIRFNRRDKLVYFFNPDGRVSSAAWGDIHFTFGKFGKETDIRGHVLEKDRPYVEESFALSYSDVQVDAAAPVLLLRHWEFIRRYMEDGPQAVTGQVQFCMPVDGRREGFKSGAERVFAEIVGAPLFMMPVLYAFGLVHICARWLVMRSSKIPRWPEEIEKLCAIEPNDPYAITADDEGNRIAVYPEAAAAHGVRFVEQPSIGEGNIGVKAPKRQGDRPEVVRRKSSSKKTGKLK